MSQGNESVEKITELIKEIDIAMLTTQTTDGLLHSRPMTTQAHHFDGDVWFFAQTGSEVVTQITAHAPVNVAYVDEGKYVSIAGKAAVVHDVTKKKALWKDAMSTWYEADGPESPEVVLIHVTAVSAQYWDTPTGFFGKAISYIKVMLSGDPHEAGESREVQLN